MAYFGASPDNAQLQQLSSSPEYDMETGLVPRNNASVGRDSEQTVAATLVPLVSSRIRRGGGFTVAAGSSANSRFDQEEEDTDDRLHGVARLSLLQRLRAQLVRSPWLLLGLALIVVISFLASARFYTARRLPPVAKGAAYLPKHLPKVASDATIDISVDPLTALIRSRARAVPTPATPAAPAASRATTSSPSEWHLPNPLYRTRASAPSISSVVRSHAPFTIFSTMRDLTAAYQLANPGEYIKTWNALRSWLRLGAPEHEAPHIILFVDHGDETCAHLMEDKKLPVGSVTCVTIPCFSREFKKPLMNCLWSRALELATTEHLVFLNGDIVLLDDFYHALQTTAAAAPHFVMVAQRSDVPPFDWPKEKLEAQGQYFVSLIADEDEIDPASGAPISGSALAYEYNYDDTEWLAAFKNHILSHSVRHADSGIDMFAFHRSVMARLDFPPFLVGVYRWDNWLLAEMLIRSAKSPFERTHGLRFNSTTSSSSNSGGIDDGAEHPPFIVVDATGALSLVHDNVRSDHLHDPGAVYNDDLVKRRTGLRYKLGRIGNADAVLRVAQQDEEEEDDELTPLQQAARRMCSRQHAHACYLEWNTQENDRLDLHLARSASVSGTIGLLSVSEPFLPMLSNFLCWTQQRARAHHPHVIVLAEDLASYRTIESWGVAGLAVLLFPNATDLGTGFPAAADSASFALFVNYRQSVMARTLDLGFSLLLLDLDAFWLETPLSTVDSVLGLFQRAEHAQHPERYTTTPVTKCTILAATRQVLVKAALPPLPPVYDEILSTSFLRLQPNKYSRYLLKRLGECTRNILAAYPAVTALHRKKEPCRYIEERCLHDLVRSMNTELSKDAAADFQTCQLPKEMWLDHTRVRLATSPQPRSAATSTNTWPWLNDPSVSLPQLKLSARLASSPLPSPPEVLGLSAGGASVHMQPKWLHDWSLGGVTSVATKVATWKRQGLWCELRPEELAKPPPRDELVPIAHPSPSSGVLLRVHVHLSPSARLTAASFSAFLRSLTRAQYDPRDTIDVAFDVAGFYAVSELQRDQERTTLKADADALAAAITADGDSSTWQLTLSEVRAVFQAFKWPHGMKQLLTAGVSTVNPAYVEAGDVPKSARETAAIQAAHRDALKLDIAGEVWSVPYAFREAIDPTNSPTIAAAAPTVDTPILLLHPSVRLDPAWHAWTKRQLTLYPKRPSSSEPSHTSVEQRWLGINLLPLVSSVSEMEPSGGDSTIAANAPYPPASALLARVVRSTLPDVTATGALRLVGDDLSQREEVRAQAASVGVNATATGRSLSGVYRTQMINPQALVLFSSSLARLHAWKKQHVAQLDEAATATMPVAAPAHDASDSDLDVPPAEAVTLLAALATPLPACWSRPGPAGAPPVSPLMSALLRFVFETGSFVTAPSLLALQQRDATDADSTTPPPVLTLAYIADSTTTATESDSTSESDSPVVSSIDVGSLFFPATLSASPLFDLAGASVPTPDTLPFRHLVLKAAHGAGEDTMVRDPECGCPWPALHPAVAQAFHVDLPATSAVPEAAAAPEAESLLLSTDVDTN